MYSQYSMFDYMSRKWDPIEAYAKMGSGFVHGKERINDFFIENSNLKDRVAFLKKEYGIGGFSGFMKKEESVISGMSNANGHEIEYVDSSKEVKKLSVSYETLVKVVDRLIRRNDYLYSNGR